MGSEAMVRRLVEHGAIGLVTTHDLALAKIAEGLWQHRPRTPILRIAWKMGN